MTWIATRGASNTTTVNVPCPSGVDGDVLAAFIYTNASAATVTPPAGFTQRSVVSRASLGKILLFTKTRAGEVTGANVAFVASSGFVHGQITDLRGVSEVATEPNANISSTTNSASIPTGLSLSPASGGTLLLFAASTATVSGTPSGMTLAQDVPGDSKTLYQEVNAGVTGDKAFTSTNSLWGAIMAEFPNAGATYTLQAGTGLFTVTGFGGVGEAEYQLQAATGHFAVSAQPATLSYNRVLRAGPGYFSVTGYPATLTYDHATNIVPADPARSVFVDRRSPRVVTVRGRRR